MKKVSFIFTILLIILFVFLGNTVQATEESVDFFIVNEIEIKSTTSTYETGTVLTIILKNTDGEVEITDPPELIIQFGSGAEIELEANTEPGTLQEIQYTYTIKDNDIGELNILREQQTTSNGVVSSNLNNITLNENIIANSDKITEDDNTSTWTDFSKATFEWGDYTETDHRTPTLTIQNVDLNKENHYYYVHISHDKNEAPDLSKIVNVNDGYWNIIKSDGKISSTILNNYLETNGDIYIWVAEVQNREQKIVLNAKKVNRLEQLPLTKRIVLYFGDSLAGGIFCYEPYTSTERKINIKIGKMTDDEILKNIKNNNANAMTNLLNYAKNADAIFENTYSFGTTNPTVPQNVGIKDQEYYFVYVELEDENGKYYPVEDVELYQASISGNTVKLLNHTDRDFVYSVSGDDETNINTGDNNVKDNTIATGKIPQTGVSATIITLILAFAVVAGFIAYKTTKYRDIK